MLEKGRNRFDQFEQDRIDERRYKYEVGYGKPPKQTQFKKGQSGNPQGRPKKSKRQPSIIETIYNMCEEKITIQTEEGVKEIEISTALAKRLIQNALNSKKVKDILPIIKIHEYVEQRHLKNELKNDNTDEEVALLQGLITDLFEDEQRQE